MTHQGVDSWYNFCILVISAGTATELHKLNSCTAAARSACVALLSFVFSDKGNKNEEIMDVANKNLAIRVTEGRCLWEAQKYMTVRANKLGRVSRNRRFTTSSQSYLTLPVHVISEGNL